MQKTYYFFFYFSTKVAGATFIEAGRNPQTLAVKNSPLNMSDQFTKENLCDWLL